VCGTIFTSYLIGEYPKRARGKRGLAAARPINFTAPRNEHSKTGFRNKNSDQPPSAIFKKNSAQSFSAIFSQQMAYKYLNGSFRKRNLKEEAYEVEM